MLQAIKEYVILDNLLRRQLNVEQRSKLELELYYARYRGSGKRSQNETLNEDIFESIAKKRNNIIIIEAPEKKVGCGERGY